MYRHCLLDYATLPTLTLRADMLLRYIQAFNNYFAGLWHRSRYQPFLPFVLASGDQDGVALLDIQLGKVERLLFLLFRCHLLQYSLVKALLAQAR
jgi:hypothetical protein